MKKLVVALLVSMMMGCAQISALINSSAESVANGIREYCLLPAETRAQFRAEVEARAAPHRAQITCAVPQ